MPSTVAPRSAPWNWPVFTGLLLLDLWAAHAVAFFAHEYAHSLVAWLLGWKHNPLALDYAHPSLTVLLIQLGINQNVDEVPMFARGHGTQAALISAAGAVLGNALITLPLSRWLAFRAQQRHAPGWAMFAYWLTVASIGNLIDYVPIRTFTNGTDLYQDMYAVERGLGWSPWTLLIVLGIPTAGVLVWFFSRIEPQTLARLCSVSPGKRWLLAVLTALALFTFYGAAGWSDAGPISHRLSVASVCIAPLMAVLGGVLASRAADRAPNSQLAPLV